MTTKNFQAVANVAEEPTGQTNSFFQTSYRKAIYWAYSLGARAHGWSGYQFYVNDDFVCLETYKANGQPHRLITMWHDADRDNDGYLFSVHTMGRSLSFQTNNLRYALRHFKSVPAQLAPVR